MENKKTIDSTIPKPPFNRRRLVEWIIFIVMLFVIITACLIEAGLFNIPILAKQKTSDNAIYQTLFSAQASMVGVVLAVLALMTNIVESKIYGLSIAQYIMKIRPIKFFRHGWIVIETTILILLTWCCVALNLNNIVVALFFVTIFLLILLTRDVLSIMPSTQRLNDKIGSYIMAMVDNAHIANLFNEINEAIVSGNAVLLQQDIDFAKQIIRKIMGNISQEDIDNLSNQFVTLIHTANESKSSKAADILDLYITTIEAANKSNMSIVEFLMASIYGTRRLFCIPHSSYFFGPHSRHLLSRWQEAVLFNRPLSKLNQEV